MVKQSQTQSWQNILWREWRHCNDEDYAIFLYRVLRWNLLGWFSRLTTWRQPRPYVFEVEAALRQACQVRWGNGYMWKSRLYNLDKTRDKPIPLEELIADLQHRYWIKRFMARHILLHRGGEAVEPLRVLAQDSSSPSQQTALWLLESISVDTIAQLAQEADRLLCPRCLVHCHAHRIDLPRRPDLTYYGCRACGQSRSFQTRPDTIIVVLDAAMPTKQLEQPDLLRVNWFQRRTLFDFDRVEIVQATDEAVERFAMQVGNDTDLLRKPRYQQMPCLIETTCRLSENSLRILERMFGHIERTGEVVDGS